MTRLKPHFMALAALVCVTCGKPGDQTEGPQNQESVLDSGTQQTRVLEEGRPIPQRDRISGATTEERRDPVEDNGDSTRPVSITVATQGSGGITVGNGGDGVKCTLEDGRTETLELLDHFEARERWDLKIDLGPPELDYKEKIKLAVDRLKYIDPMLHLHMRNETARFLATVKFKWGKTELVDIKDSFHIILQENCDLVQIATQGPPATPSDSYYLVNGRYFFELLDNDGRAGLVLHEALYRRLAPLVNGNSTDVRYLNAYFSSSGFESGGLKGYFKVLNALKLPYFLGSITFPLWNVAVRNEVADLSKHAEIEGIFTPDANVGASTKREFVVGGKASTSRIFPQLKKGTRVLASWKEGQRVAYLRMKGVDLGYYNQGLAFNPLLPGVTKVSGTVDLHFDMNGFPVLITRMPPEAISASADIKAPMVQVPFANEPLPLRLITFHPNGRIKELGLGWQAYKAVLAGRELTLCPTGNMLFDINGNIRRVLFCANDPIVAEFGGLSFELPGKTSKYLYFDEHGQLVLQPTDDQRQITTPVETPQAAKLSDELKSRLTDSGRYLFDMTGIDRGIYTGIKGFHSLSPIAGEWPLMTSALSDFDMPYFSDSMSRPSFGFIFSDAPLPGDLNLRFNLQPDLPRDSDVYTLKIGASYLNVPPQAFSKKDGLVSAQLPEARAESLRVILPHLGDSGQYQYRLHFRIEAQDAMGWKDNQLYFSPHFRFTAAKPGFDWRYVKFTASDETKTYGGKFTAQLARFNADGSGQPIYVNKVLTPYEMQSNTVDFSAVKFD